MAKYRDHLPQLDGNTFLTDGGLETTLIFHDDEELLCFAAFDLLTTAAGVDKLYRYYDRYCKIAIAQGVGFTWRASRDWGQQLGYDAAALDTLNTQAI